MSQKRNLKEEIVKLRIEGFSSKKIASILQCSKGTVSYYLSKIPELRNTISDNIEKANIAKRNPNKINPIYTKMLTYKVYSKKYKVEQNKTTKISGLIWMKLAAFSRKHGETMNQKPEFTFEDLKNKLGESPKCYLTGEPIDLSKPRTYEFDHIIPRSRGGDNSIDNLGICTKQANRSKRDMTPDEYINLCKRVLENNGYDINKSKT